MIILKDINKSFGDNIVLKDFSCNFKENQFNGIMGKSGSGKTTLLRIMMGLERQDSGKIYNFDKENVSVVFQENRLLENFSIKENINLVLDNKLSSKKLEKYLKALDLDVKKDEKVKNLSGGMKRRISLLRGVIFEAETYIFDEPFKDIDGRTKKKVLNFVKDKLNGKTVIFTTHDIEDIIFLNDGNKNILEMEYIK